MAIYEPWDEALAEAIVERHKDREGATLPIFHALQEVFGCVPAEAVPMVARALNLSRAEVHGVLTFYSDFRQEPPGRHILKLCRAEACQAAGGDALAEDLQQRLGIRLGETTADHLMTAEPVFCLGLCAVAPSAMLDERPVGRLDAAKLEALVAEARS
ncbi:formate dehydrogenase subunit gamma [Beijerinckia mobilis]|uniref:formate dehydrogenase subunit gamma n=1 Tax=Beijerinckia mobilis TaxID=231434 RepID=UPI000555DE83|nr:formate dehydrogenase subunit gamma [Beijerinckia mobilis]